ncbi:MAG: hypothetical protein LUI10_04320 [Lachnospiraceae bacterium]|nr:hypothetical protein [Lachnospiraceae bacterium]
MHFKDIIHSVQYSFRLCRERKRFICVSMAARAGAALLLPLLTSYMSRQLVRCITDECGMYDFAAELLSLALGVTALSLISVWAQSRMKLGAELVKSDLGRQINVERMTVPYEKNA